MRLLLLAAAFVCFSVNVKAQLASGGFETWITDAFGNAVPANWYTDFSAEHSIAMDTGAYEGNYALRVMSRTPGIEGPYYGYLTTKVAAESMSGVLTCQVAVDSFQHWAPDSAYAIVRIDTSALYDGWNNNIPFAGLWKTATPTNGYVEVAVPFTLPGGVDSFYVHVVAKNITQSLTNLNLGYVSFRVDDMSLSFTTNAFEINRDNAISVYPNPTANQLVIKDASRYMQCAIYDSRGSLLRNGLVDEIIDVSGLDNGNYFLLLRNTQGESNVIVFTVVNER